MCRAPNESSIPIRLDLATREAIKKNRPVAEFLPRTGGVFEVSQTDVCADAEPVRVPCMSVAHHLLSAHPGHLFALFGSKESRHDVVNACDAPEAAVGVLSASEHCKVHKSLHICLVNSSPCDVTARFIVEEHEPATAHMRKRRQERGPSLLTVCRGQDALAAEVTGSVVVPAGSVDAELSLRPTFRIKTTFTVRLVVEGAECFSWTFNLVSSNTQRVPGKRVLPTQRVPRVFRMRITGEPDAASRTVLSVYDTAASRFPSLMTVPTSAVPANEWCSGATAIEASAAPGAGSAMCEEAEDEAAARAPVVATARSGFAAFAGLGGSLRSLGAPLPSFGSLASLGAAVRGGSVAMQLGKRKRCEQVTATVAATVDRTSDVPPPKRRAVAASILCDSSDSTSSGCSSPLGSVLSEDGVGACSPFAAADWMDEEVVTDVHLDFERLLADSMPCTPFDL